MTNNQHFNFLLPFVGAYRMLPMALKSIEVLVYLPPPGLP